MEDLKNKFKDSIAQLPTVPDTPEELNSEMRECQILEFGDPENWQMNTRVGDEPSPVVAFASLFFLSSVTCALPQGGFRQVAPRYCATGYGAAAMLKLIQLNYDPQAALYQDWPADQSYGGGYTPNRKVPWIRVSSGATANCGLQLEYFTHNYPPQKALQAAIGEFRTDF